MPFGIQMFGRTTSQRESGIYPDHTVAETYQKTREANSRSGSAPQTCHFYEELHAILGGDTTTTPKHSVDTSQEPQETSSNNEEDIVDKEEEEEENVRQASGGSILPNSQELFLILETIPSQDQLAVECDVGEGTSAETLSVGASSTPGQTLSQIRRRKKNKFNELMHASKSEKIELRAWRITLLTSWTWTGRTGEHATRVKKMHAGRDAADDEGAIRHVEVSD
ncbi:uncharacterized protein [Lepidochelys kempii]|uniref:uncharacterized protein n=1 Tax=Lepidochelys kempii TaxID=8472 RepID=UPI003C6ED873